MLKSFEEDKIIKKNLQHQSFQRIDLADIVDVRKGFSTDIFNEVIEHD